MNKREITTKEKSNYIGNEQKFGKDIKTWSVTSKRDVAAVPETLPEQLFSYKRQSSNREHLCFQLYRHHCVCF